MEFWVNAINSAIIEELTKQTHGVTEINKETKEHEKNLVFCQLVSFGHIMLSFKLSSNSTKELVNTYAIKYSFSMDETENIMLAVNESLDYSE